MDLYRDLADPMKGLAEGLHHRFRLHGVEVQQFPLLLSEFPGFHGFVGNGEHADVVHETAQPQRHAAAFVVIHLHAQAHGKDGDIGAALGQGVSFVPMSDGDSEERISLLELFAHRAHGSHRG